MLSLTGSFEALEMFCGFDLNHLSGDSINNNSRSISIQSSNCCCSEPVKLL